MKVQNMLINGEWVPAASGHSFAVYNPATGAVVGEAPAGSAADAASAISAADDAFDGWAQMPAAKRAAILRRAGDLLRSREEPIAKLITLEAGKVLRASHKEVNTAAEFIYGMRRRDGVCTASGYPIRFLIDACLRSDNQ